MPTRHPFAMDTTSASNLNMTTPKPTLKWSKQFSVTTSDRVALPGDKILLPPSALEDLLEATSAVAAHAKQRDLPAYDPYNSSTWSAHRRAEAEFQDQWQQLLYPLTFRLVNGENERVVYAGIREFSAEEGQVVLSPFLWESLGLKAHEANREDAMEVDGKSLSSTITIHAKILPKGTFAKLRPMEAGYDPEDWKALLEQYLRQNYTTLTNGEVLIVPGPRGAGGKKEEFRFLVDGFKPDVDGICIVDTDLEVDIEALNEEQARETLKRVAAKLTRLPGSEQGTSPGGELDLFKEQTGQVLPGEYVDYQLPSWIKSQALDLELHVDDEDVDLDLLVSPFSATQRVKPRLDEHVFADLEGRPRKRIRIEPTNAELEKAEALFISVHACDITEHPTNDTSAGSNARPRHYTLRARHTDDKSDSSQLKLNDDDVAPNEGDVRCKNCLQWVPGRALMLHENFCLRNNIACPKGCGQVFQKRSPAYEAHWHCLHDVAYGSTPATKVKHDSIFHPDNVLRCQDCNTKETFPNIIGLSHHRTTTCPSKLILCRFCHLEVPQEGDPDQPSAEVMLSGLTAHELADGARTTECHLCSRIVRLRDMEVHLRTHDLDRLNRLAPQPCRNILCGRTRDRCGKNGDTRAGTKQGQGSGNDIGLCSTCFGPLYVSMYDPEGKALRRRIERRYLQQLAVTNGCGKAHCKNEYCKAGRKNMGIAGTIIMKDGMTMVKPFIEGLEKPLGEENTPLHFCVDQRSQTSRQMAEMLAAEDGGFTGKTYEFEWCVGALEAEEGDLERARTWLKNWAPTKLEQVRR
ncbi:hypothetical protein LTR78_000718 [Recurvomyces mirabilis]|uniref:Ubiquitin-protein ligase E3A N-terminal zinc-binding domain-containing protein n=1 Tax=Recurvomyces mirabilis TaxID=574656 RepID=A0AAE0WVR9_9PEZI|nr:hypothetical protein LTR78_000718 [Recurvomyces mirabilis]KAK5158688.1 hypothetical protein LTS14_002796 [Recurvomyces mirabilis]